MGRSELSGGEGGEGPAAVPKPDELLALNGVTSEMFATLRSWFDVPPEVTLDLREVDSAVAELGDPVLVAAMAMRKLQALHLLATPGVRTTTDVVVTIVQDLQRALLQAPAMRLKLAAQNTDWDAELAGLGEAGGPAQGDAPSSADDLDPDVERFRVLHALLVAAVEAVLRASEGEIRYLV
ncbi:MAG: hypothetical protein M3N25_01410 [Actinomycetota bacterium]|nr:hypothetical protein [Actinomycetota bacterium]